MFLQRVKCTERNPTANTSFWVLHSPTTTMERNSSKQALPGSLSCSEVGHGRGIYRVLAMKDR